MENAKVNYSTLIINSSDCQSISSKIPLTLVSSGSAAKTAIMDMRRRFAAIFIDPILGHPGGVELISLAHRHRPATPIYVLYKKTKPFTDQQAVRLAVQEQLQLPLSAWSIKERIASEIYDFTFENAEYPPVSSPSAEDVKYRPIPAMDFLTGAPSIFDVYVRLPSGRFFKVLNARDSFVPDRLLGYLQKGITHFFVNKASVGRCLDYCDIMAQFLITHQDVSLELKASDLFNKGERLIHAIQLDGLTHDHLEFAVTFVGQIRNLLNQIDIKNRDHLDALLSNIPMYDRAVSTAMLTGLLALPLKVESESAFRAIGLAALLHDIGLLTIPKNVRDIPIPQMSPQQLALYQEHPTRGAEILSKIPEIDEVSIQAVAQHHERRNKTGFPGKVKSSEINRIAELIGISNEFLDLLETAKKDPSVKPLQLMQKHVFDGFSFPVIESFRTLFMPQPHRPRPSVNN